MTLLLFLLLLPNWKPGLIERHTYKLGEEAIPGTVTYTLSGVVRDGKPAFEVDMEKHATLTLGGQAGKLETRGRTFVDPQTFDLLECSLTTTMNGAEVSYLHTVRNGAAIEVHQQLRGSALEKRTVSAPGIAIEESVLTFYVARLPWKAGQVFKWNKYNVAQPRLAEHKGMLDVKASNKEKTVIAVQTDIAPTVYEMLPGAVPVVSRVSIGGSEQLRLIEDPAKP